VTFDLNVEAYRALIEGGVDAVVDDRPIGGFFARMLPGLRLAQTIAGTESAYALMLAKGNDQLREAVNEALRELREDGTHERLVRRWFGRADPASSPEGTKAPAEPRIARLWRGRTRAADADRYVNYLRETGVREYRAVPGNAGVRILRRTAEGEAEFLVLSFWDSLDAIRGFAGDDLERAVYYPQDEAFLLEKEPGVRHYEVVVDEGDGPS
jgi:heme-degrading monooxygenase HmoA